MQFSFHSFYFSLLFYLIYRQLKLNFFCLSLPLNIFPSETEIYASYLSAIITKGDAITDKNPKLSPTPTEKNPKYNPENNITIPNISLTFSINVEMFVPLIFSAL